MVKKGVIAVLAVLVLGVLVFSLIPGRFAGAQTVVIDEDINKAAGSLEIGPDTLVNGDVTLNLGELTVYGVINGNVNSNMGQINIIGDVNGDVEANMGQVVISGSVTGDVKARMGEIIVDGSVGGNLTADLGAARINGTVGGDVGSGFGELRIGGAVAGDVSSKGGKVLITGIIEGDVILDQGVVELGPDAVVSGRIYVARGQVQKAATAIVGGTVEIGEEVTPAELIEDDPEPGYRFEGVEENLVETVTKEVRETIERSLRDVRFMPHMVRTREWFVYPYPFMGFYGNVARGVLNMLIMFALAAFTYTLFPRHVKAAGDAISAKTGPVIGWGLLAAVLAIPLMILLAITIIGIPLIFVEIIFLAAAAVLGYTGIVELVGSRVIGAASKTAVNPLGAIALGVLIIGLIAMIPVLGGLVSLAVFVLAIGAALVTRFGSKDPAEPAPPSS